MLTRKKKLFSEIKRFDSRNVFLDFSRKKLTFATHGATVGREGIEQNAQFVN